jgi:hypothetical protein
MLLKWLQKLQLRMSQDMALNLFRLKSTDLGPDVSKQSAVFREADLTLMQLSILLPFPMVVAGHPAAVAYNL